MEAKNEELKISMRHGSREKDIFTIQELLNELQEAKGRPKRR
jgi:hypothetical protein